VRQRWPRFSPLAGLPLPWLTAIGAGAGMGEAFRSPLLGVAYAIEELNREQAMSLVLPTLLVAGSGALVSTRLGQPARLEGLELGPLPPQLWAWALLITVVAAALGSLFVRLLIPLAAVVSRGTQSRRAPLALLVALLLTLLAVLSSGLSLNDGSLSLAASLQGLPGGSRLTLLWRFLASLLSIATGAPGGLMHDAMSLGGLLVVPLQGVPGLISVPEAAWAQLAAVGATALFAAANGTPLFCALFVFTLQGDPQLLPVLLLASALSVWLAQRWRGPTWNEAQVEGLEASLTKAAS
jgi:H+/Cl- antiporter ClcA